LRKFLSTWPADNLQCQNDSANLVLERTYGLDAPAIAAFIERVLQTDVLVVEHEQEVFTAMALLKQGSASFADSLILSLAEKAGCQTTLTFDRKALRLPGYSPT